MADASAGLPAVTPAATRKRPYQGGFARIAKYTLMRLVALFITIVVGVYLTVLIANMGGYVDQIRSSQIREGISIAISMDEGNRLLTPVQRRELIDSLVALEESRLGLDRPFMLRSFSYLTNALTLNLGRAEQMVSDSGSRQVRLIILERLAPTLLLTATGNLLLFFTALFLGLFLSRRYGSWLDRAIIALAPTSAAPAWFFGIFLILIFSALLGWFPFGGLVSSPPPAEPLAYAGSVLKHLFLPATSIVISAVFLSSYAYRTFFLIYSSEDYVEMAKAKGLASSTIERRYVLRPTLPTIITQFALLVINLWAGSIVLETVFNWPGLGRLFFEAVNRIDTPIIVGNTVIYAYLLGVTVFLLDFAYAIVDPRVKLDGGGTV